MELIRTLEADLNAASDCQPKAAAQDRKHSADSTPGRGRGQGGGKVITGSASASADRVHAGKADEPGC